MPILALGQTNKKGFTELNMGIATIDGYKFYDAFPGASLLIGKTFSKNGLVSEYQVGIAFPTVCTGKVAVGYGDLSRNIMIACRPYPLTFGPQIKLGKLTSSFEVGFNNTFSFDAGFIATVGYRWQFKNKKWQFKNKKNNGYYN